MQQASLGLNCRPNDLELHLNNVNELKTNEIVIKQESSPSIEQINNVKIKIELPDKNIDNVKVENLVDTKVPQNNNSDRVGKNKNDGYNNNHHCLDDIEQREWELEEIVDFSQTRDQYPAMQHPAYRAVGPGPPNAFGFPHFYPPSSSSASSVISSMLTGFHDRSHSSTDSEKHMQNVRHQNHQMQDNAQSIFRSRQTMSNTTSDFNEQFSLQDYRSNHHNSTQHDFHYGKSSNNISVGYPPGYRTSLELMYFNQQRQQHQKHQAVNQQNILRNMYPSGRQRKWSNSALRFLQPTSVSLEKRETLKAHIFTLPHAYTYIHIYMCVYICISP